MDPHGLHRSARNDAGFTLAEVLVVLALLSLLTGVLFGSLRFGILAWERTTSRSTAIDQNLLVQDFLRRTIAAAYPSFVATSPTQSRVDFSGTEISVNFLGPTPVAREVGGRSRYTISLEQDGNGKALTVVSQSELAADEQIPKVRDTLLANLEGVEFAYLAKMRAGPPEWRSAWTSESSLPQLVRIRVKFRNGDPRSWPELLIAPRIDVDVGCIYDALTRLCRGQ